jgi:ribosomal protein S27AE
VTRRERADQVIALRAEGLYFHEIGERLGIGKSYAHQLFHDPDGSEIKAYRQDHLEEELLRRRAWQARNGDRKRAAQRRYRLRHKDELAADLRRRREANPQQAQAWNKLDRAVRSGRITRPDVCSQCSRGGRIEAHHDDYSQPLEVRWLCSRCHSSVPSPLSPGGGRS